MLLYCNYLVVCFCKFTQGGEKGTYLWPIVDAPSWIHTFALVNDNPFFFTFHFCAPCHLPCHTPIPLPHSLSFFWGLLLALLSIIVFSLLQDSLLYFPLLKCLLFVCEYNALCFFCSFFARIIVVSMCHQSSLLVSIYAWVLATSPYHQSSLLLFIYVQFAYVASCSCHSLHLLFCQNFLFLFISPKTYVVVYLCAICLCCFVVITHYAFSFAKILYCCLFVHDSLMLICSCCSRYTFSLFVVLKKKLFGLLCNVLV